MLATTAGLWQNVGILRCEHNLAPYCRCTLELLVHGQRSGSGGGRECVRHYIEDSNNVGIPRSKHHKPVLCGHGAAECGIWIRESGAVGAHVYQREYAARRVEDADELILRARGAGRWARGACVCACAVRAQLLYSVPCPQFSIVGLNSVPGSPPAGCHATARPA